MDIAPRYNPKEVEEKILKHWLSGDFFAAKVSDKKPFSIVIPPPNITGILHMGHALNNTIQDVLIRFKRMQGYSALWMPGTDHAGIATQNVVEKDLAKQGLKKEDIGREEFLKKLWLWRDKYGSTIISQLQKLGASCDWQRTRFTMDEAYSETVKDVFVRLYEKDLIYRGKRIINWCPRCKTALSDEEAAHKEINGWLYYIKYPVIDVPCGEASLHSALTRPTSHIPRYVVVATTRPETMLGDTAVAINPKDERFTWLKGAKVILPIMDRELKVIEDEVVDIEFGTGVVKVTPSHDPVDFNLGKKHNLEFINIMNDDASLNEMAGEFSGMDRFEAREAILELLEEKKLIDKKEPYKVSAGHCYRCHTIIEPRMSPQWFVKMKPLAQAAIKVVEDDKVKFHPERWKKVYLNWMYNIQDWCISRQIWWGHRLPVWYCKECL
ncbi:MAG: valine--tRNA ligase, partial [Candidatus Omnitrophota bacterium]